LGEFFVQEISSGVKDPLWVVVEELGEYIPEISEHNNTNIQLFLKNKLHPFDLKSNPSTNEILYQTTIEIVINVLKAVPLQQISGKNLNVILQLALDLGKKTSDKSLEMNASRALEYLTRLEKIQVVSREDGYSSILRAVALEVIHRSQHRQQQKKRNPKITRNPTKTTSSRQTDEKKNFLILKLTSKLVAKISLINTNLTQNL